MVRRARTNRDAARIASRCPSLKLRADRHAIGPLLVLLAATWFLPLCSSLFAVEFVTPTQDLAAPIAARADHARHWSEGEYEVWLLQGNCELRQGKLTARCRDAVLWVDQAEPLSAEPTKVIAYLESDVWMKFHERADHVSEREPTGGDSFNSDTSTTSLGKAWLGRWQTLGPIEITATESPTAESPTAESPAAESPTAESPAAESPTGNASMAAGPNRLPIYGRGIEALGWHNRSGVRPAQFAEPLPAVNPSVERLPSPVSASPIPTARQVNIIPRSSLGAQVQTYPGSTAEETILAVTGGVRVVVSGIEGIAAPAEIPVLPTGVVMIEADRVVAWTTAFRGLGGAAGIGGGLGDAGTGAGGVQGNSGRWEIYLEGNIVFREGDRVIYSDRLYYNVNENRGTILNAELLTPVPGYEGLLRLKADVIQQLDSQNFEVNGAALTSSRLGVPRYWLQSENMTLSMRERPRLDPRTGLQLFDPQTSQPLQDNEILATSRNNFIYVGGIPIFYWPVAVTDATKPTYYVDRVRLNNDNVFGSQVFIDWDTYQVFGRRPIEGTKWTFATDYLSDRGPAAGTTFKYDRDSVLGIPGTTHGLFDAWGIKEEGLDNLGADRRTLLPEEDLRGRVLWQHRQRLLNGFQVTAELGLISDRNFLEQYYEEEWDQNKDQTTGLELKRFEGHSSWAISADTRLNDFFTQTEHLPRFDHFLIGQSVFGALTWHGHSNIGYEHLRSASAPQGINPGEVAVFDPLAWEADREGLHVGTRQELDWPIQLGAVKVVPYVLGEASRWGEDLAGNEVTRYYGQTGVRASLPIWRADPMVQNTLFNLNGLAHKIVFDAEFLYADAEENLDTLALYDQLDDDATEHFRRRLFFNTFGGPLAVGGPNTPLQFDERYFALRSGMQSWVTAPSSEIADDLMFGKFGVRQRWQTKRGLPGQERIVDWIVFDVEGYYFPKADRDNFGEEVGLLDYDFRWHVGDRLTVLSDGFADLFGQGLRTFTIGSAISRPERGNLYFGYRSIEGPISSNILLGSLSYRMTDKWIATGGASFDLSTTGNIGQTFQLTRVGESALVRLGFNYDASRDNFGVNLAIEPRFLPSSKLGRVGGVQVPPAGAYGLE